MNCKKAYKLLDISYPYTERELKKAYYKMSLKYHPDKNKEGLEKFRDINEAYEYLLKTEHHKQYNHNESGIPRYENGSFEEFIMDYVKNVFHMDYKIFEEILDNIDTISVNIPNNIFTKIRSFIIENQNIFNRKYDKKIYSINPSLDKVLSGDIYVLYHNNQKFYIPLWHQELEYDDFIIQIIPSCLIKDDNINNESYCDKITKYISQPFYTKNTIFTTNKIKIDDDNNIYCNLYIPIHYLYQYDVFHFSIDEVLFEYKSTDVYIKKEQDIRIKNKGIPKNNTKNIYSVTLRSDIIIHLSI